MTVAAFFDVDGTLTRSTVLEPLVWYQRAHLARVRFAVWSVGLLLQLPYYLLIDRRSRVAFNHAFFRRYAGLKAAELRAWHRHSFVDNLQRRFYPRGLDCLRAHQRQGHRIVLVTGGLDFVMQPLAEFVGADELLALRLVERAGVFTGDVDGPPVAEEHKAALVREYAQKHGIDLARSHGYGNNLSDAPMLACTGHPTAVNPDRRLRRLAGERGWPIVEWAGSP
jgi:HAD superfamily hydrolase (TIGR01490 family)